MKKKVLFLCTGNSCRSQMAEGWARKLGGASIEAYSAGTAPHGIDPRAIAVMDEVGIDIRQQGSTHVEALRHLTFDLVVSVCDRAAKNCPVFPGPHEQHHRPFDDPPALARSATSEIEALAHYRRVRDEIRAMVQELIR